MVVGKAVCEHQGCGVGDSGFTPPSKGRGVEEVFPRREGWPWCVFVSSGVCITQVGKNRRVPATHLQQV